MYKTVIFDFNGTLLDDCDCCLKILNLLTKEYGLGYVSKEHYKSIFTFPVYEYYQSLGFDVSFDSFEKVGKKFHKYYNEFSYKEVKLFDDVKPLLSFLKDNNYKIVCLSATKIDTLVKQLKFYGIYEYFNDVVGLNDALANSKEKVAIEYMNSCNMNPSEVIFVGDSIHDFEVANAINVKAILVSTGHTNKDRLLKVTSDVIDSLSDIKKYL